MPSQTQPQEAESSATAATRALIQPQTPRSSITTDGLTPTPTIPQEQTDHSNMIKTLPPSLEPPHSTNRTRAIINFFHNFFNSPPPSTPPLPSHFHRFYWLCCKHRHHRPLVSSFFPNIRQLTEYWQSYRYRRDSCSSKTQDADSAATRYAISVSILLCMKRHQLSVKWT